MKKKNKVNHNIMKNYKVGRLVKDDKKNRILVFFADFLSFTF